MSDEVFCKDCKHHSIAVAYDREIGWYRTSGSSAGKPTCLSPKRPVSVVSGEYISISCEENRLNQSVLNILNVRPLYRSDTPYCCGIAAAWFEPKEEGTD